MSLLTHIAVDSLILSMYEQSRALGALDWEKPNTAQLFRVNMRLSHNGYRNEVYLKKLEKTGRCVMSIIVTSRHRVYVAHHADYRDAHAVVGSFVNTSNHDSCWKSDGVQTPLTEKYFNLAEEMYASVHDTLRPAPAELTPETYLGDWLGYNLMQFVEIERGPKREDNNNFDTLLSVKPLKFTIALGEK